MNRRRIVPAILISACFALGVVSLLRLQANAPRRLLPLPDHMSPLDRPANLALAYAADGTIRAQLTALRQNDIPAAEGYESHFVMEDVTSPEQFREYATADYPELAYFERIKFGSATTDADNQRVLVRASVMGAGRATLRVSFLLIRDEDGIYRILGMRTGRRPASEVLLFGRPD